jgi:hypothetical protein
MQCARAVWFGVVSCEHPTMKLEELKEAVIREEHIVLFLPYLRLGKSYRVAGVDFVPLRTKDGKVTSGLESSAGPLDKILSGYIDRHGKPLQNCVVASIPGKGWDIEESDFLSVRWASSLLFLSSWSCNSYYGLEIGRYVNSSNFRLVGQRFRGSMPGYIAISTRRRDGSSMDGGYKHGNSNSVCLCRFQYETRHLLMSASLLPSTQRRSQARFSSND